jgi:hypothetical protein
VGRLMAETRRVVVGLMIYGSLYFAPKIASRDGLFPEQYEAMNLTYRAIEMISYELIA